MKDREKNKQLRSLKELIDDLTGILSIRELTTNWRFLNEYKALHRACFEL